jgi:hypothetical protein
MMKKKAMAYWSAVCPGCNIGRKYPKSFIGKRVVEHWEEQAKKTVKRDA